ncbi:hypothetical protein F2P81_022645 [Scophthalmus maximus]|uniref:Uncharacterized protein n=1 Tax=Scophthalmus maximus TaxID=52904 RepID=A0A6A4S5E7_SCOMX|nr:hypothetical protein F2P81_022645 [Scophthalmus maximus]
MTPADIQRQRLIYYVKSRRRKSNIQSDFDSLAMKSVPTEHVSQTRRDIRLLEPPLSRRKVMPPRSVDVYGFSDFALEKWTANDRGLS